MSSDGGDVEAIRERLGYDTAQRGEPLHESASETFRKSYSRFGSNVTPRRFGMGRDKPSAWKCVCGHENKSYLTRCWVCNTLRGYSEDK